MAKPKKYQYVYEVLDAVRKTRDKKDKVAILKLNESWALKDVLRGHLDDRVQWDLPAGAPPYTASEEHNAPSDLRRRNVDFKYFAKGTPANRQIGTYKKEQLFIGLLESIHPEDAKVVINMINKEKLDGITANAVNEAFPNLIPQ